jgi:very-short-patch-repair endonuclease
MSEINTALVIKKYVDEKESVHSIAAQLGTYPVKIFRILKKAGIPRRSRSEAQSTSLETGRHTHPTEGRERTDEEKLKISNSRYESWKHADREAHSEKCKVNWNKMSKRDRQEFNKKGNAAVRVASKKGSKLELYLHEQLLREGIAAKLHVENLIDNEAMHVDMYLPEKRTVIEIDGPTHFLPIWGDKNLKRHQKADRTKTGLLLAAGYNIVRVKNLCKSLSAAKKRDAFSKLLTCVNSIQKQDNKMVEMEVN